MSATAAVLLVRLPLSSGWLVTPLQPTTMTGCYARAPHGHVLPPAAAFAKPLHVPRRRCGRETCHGPSLLAAARGQQMCGQQQHGAVAKLRCLRLAARCSDILGP
jgi:hypothetical protein